MIMLDLLPAALWLVSFVLSVVITASCVASLLRVRSNDASAVKPVGLRMVWCHIWSVGCAACTYFVWALYGSSEMDVNVAKFYRSVGLVSAIVIVCAVLMQLVLLTIRARKAADGQMDRRLAGVVDRSRNHS